MAKFDEDNDILDENEVPKNKINKKKILVFLLPVLIVIGSIVSFYSVLNKKFSAPEVLPYNVVQQTGTADGAGKFLIFYDLPEISTQIKDVNGEKNFVKIKINIELSSVEDAKKVEELMPKITDAIISYTKELNAEEVNGSSGLYWLKEELLYRINLIVSPVNVSNLNFKNFEIQKNS